MRRWQLQEAKNSLSELVRKARDDGPPGVAVSYLLDTCVISDLAKPKPAGGVVAWFEGSDETALYLSVLTLGELEMGIARLPVSARR